MNSIGIMQGRLTPRGSKPIQFFPFENWQNEFRDARQIGIDEIEFIFDYDRYEENPLWSDAGVNAIKNLISDTGVLVNTICADYFMARPFFRTTEETRRENISILSKLIDGANAVGAKRIEIPLLDNSSIKTAEEEEHFIISVREPISQAREKNIAVNIEADLPPKKFKSFLEKFDGRIGVTYDAGNSSGLGYDPSKEISEYGNYISNIHIKDRALGGSTVPLGSGNANFESFFKTLKGINYKGSFILQVARGEDGSEEETVRKQKEFVLDYINKYL